MRVHKLIKLGWLVYLAAFIIPWSGRLFSGWISGWFWVLIDFMQFLSLLTGEVFKIQNFAATLSTFASICMLISPLLIYFAKKGEQGVYCYIPIIGLIFAATGSVLKIITMGSSDGFGVIYVIANIIWVTAFFLVWKGFKEQLQYIKTHYLTA